MPCPSRIQLFDRCAGAVFARLYESFPERLPIDFSRDVPASLFDDADTEDDIWQKFNIFEPTVRWLEQAGYLWSSGFVGSTANEVVLTPKALEVMKAVSFKNEQSLGEFLAEAVKSGAKHEVEKAVRAALNIGIKAIWRSGWDALT